jgi:hypothetical protein
LIPWAFTRRYEFNHLIGGEEHAVIERELKAVLQEWMILERDYLPMPVPLTRSAGP